MKPMLKKIFINILLQSKKKIYVLYVISLANSNLHFYFSSKTTNKNFISANIFITILHNYMKFANVILFYLAIELLNHIKIINHAIELIDNNFPPYKFIYIQKETINLKILRTLIKNILVNSFILFLKFVVTLFFFFC